MNCKEVIRQLSEYLDGELDPPLLDQLRKHFDGCEHCRLLVDTTRKTIEIYCNCQPLPLPAAVSERLKRAIAAKFASQK